MDQVRKKVAIKRSGIVADAMIEATVGVTYRLSKKSWKRPADNHTPNGT